MGSWIIKITVCNVPVGLLENVIVSFLNAYGHSEEVNPIRAVQARSMEIIPSSFA